MNNISILIVDDDLNKISAIISTIKQSSEHVLVVKQASNVQEAIDWLTRHEFHLLITDLMMPLKYDGEADPRGGESLIKNMYRRRKNLHIPMYIVGLTQFDDLQSIFEGVWKVWHFDIGSNEWKNRLRDLIFHISLVNSRIAVIKTETFYVEGPLDRDVFLESFRIFYPKQLEMIRIETRDFGGGASWVERQLVIWAKSLTVKVGENGYLKAVGVFDDDDAGNKAISRLLVSIKEHSAESQTFSVVKCAYKYSSLLKSIRSKGLTFPTTLEEMIGIEIWKVAKKKNWLVKRDEKYYSVDLDTLPLMANEVSEDSLAFHGFSAEERLISLYKVDDKHKENFKKLSLNQEFEKRRAVLINIGYILKEVLAKFKIPC